MLPLLSPESPKDIIFARVKDKAARRVNVGQFEDGLRDISAKKGVAFEAVAQAIQETDGPLFEATVAQPNRFSDRSEGGGMRIRIHYV